MKIQKCFEDYIKGDISEEKLKVIIEELTKEKNKLALNLDKGLKQTKPALSQVSKRKIDDGLILKLISSASVVNAGKRKYKVHIDYNFKNKINGAKLENAPKIWFCARLNNMHKKSKNLCIWYIFSKFSPIFVLVLGGNQRNRSKF